MTEASWSPLSIVGLLWAMDAIAGAKARQLARVAGGLYLINILGGAFAVGIVPAMLIVRGDASATALNIQSHDLLYRLSLVATIIVSATCVPLAVIFYDLFKGVHRRITLLVVFFTLVFTAVGIANLLNQFVPVVLLGNGPAASGLPLAQAQALSYMSANLSEIGYSINSVFFGFYGICIGYLVFRSTFLPRLIGVLLALGAISYATYGLANILTPSFSANLVPWIQLPSLMGEGSFTLWLLLKGVNVTRWTERAGAADRVGSTTVKAAA